MVIGTSNVVELPTSGTDGGTIGGFNVDMSFILENKVPVVYRYAYVELIGRAIGGPQMVYIITNGDKGSESISYLEVPTLLPYEAPRSRLASRHVLI
jgi:hypothetical protein